MGDRDRTKTPIDQMFSVKVVRAYLLPGFPFCGVPAYPFPLLEGKRFEWRVNQHHEGP